MSDMDDRLKAARLSTEARRIKRVEAAGGFAHENLTVRDYFAAKAMRMTFVAANQTSTVDAHAKSCYEMADAMMKARES